MIGGWIIGTRDMYEYAATAIGPRIAVCSSFPARKMDVGPSAPPIMEIAAAALSENPIAMAPRYAAKMPNCAAAPRRKALRVRDQRSEVGHRSDSEEDQGRQDGPFIKYIEIVQEVRPFRWTPLRG